VVFGIGHEREVPLETFDRFADLFAQANTRKGPFLIELMI
jgi:hypothetical protein